MILKNKVFKENTIARIKTNCNNFKKALVDARGFSVLSEGMKCKQL